MKSKITLLFLFFLLGISVFGQQETPRKITWRDRIFFGGNLNLSFGSVTWVEVSPIVGYRLSSRVVLGTGFTYIYYKNNYRDFSTHIYGGRIFTQYTVIKNVGDFLPFMGYTSIFGHAEDEILSIDNKLFDPYNSRSISNNLWIGPGLKQKVGLRSGIYFLVLWNVMENQYSLYSSPIFRFGFIF